MTDTSAVRGARTWVSYRSIWRWHFYAGLFCIPFIIILALTGSFYLFKPQLEALLDRPYDHLTLSGAPRSPQAQVDAALAAVPGAKLKDYEVRREADDAARVLLRAPGGEVRVYVHPETNQVLKIQPESGRLLEIDKTIHGELLMGDRGSVLVELAASWAIVMIVTGLYLWWPRDGRAIAGVLYPRLSLGGRIFWRDLHAVVGFWVSGLALFLLLTGLPWTNVWGAGFKEARRLTGTAAARQDWTQSRAAERSADQAEDHAGHEMAGMDMSGMDMSAMDMSAMDTGGPAALPAPPVLDLMVAQVRPLDLPPPVLISPPSRRGEAASTHWTARSETQNRPLRVTLTLDGRTGRILKRSGFAARHPLDRLVGYGIAAHEGQLFGLANQLLGVATALGLITLSVSALVMWWRRRPRGRLGAPALPENPRIALGLCLIILALGLFLPVLGASLILLGLTEKLVLSRLPGVRAWLGLAPAAQVRRTSPG